MQTLRLIAQFGNQDAAETHATFIRGLPYGYEVVVLRHLHSWRVYEVETN